MTNSIRKERIVSIEVGESGSAELFYRNPDGVVDSCEMPFSPWLLVAGGALAASLEGAQSVTPLSHASGSLDTMVFFQDTASYDDAVKQLKKLTGYSVSSPLAPYRIFSDLQYQAMVSLQVRLFGKMEFEDIRRLQLDIETRTSVPGCFCDAKRPGDEVLMVSLKDNTGWEMCLTNKDGEKALLQKVVEMVQERDPDVIEGHNIFEFDLQYLEIRCKRHKVPFAIGRNGRLAAGRASRFTAGERTINYRRYDIYGRHVIDTLFLTLLFDVSARDMESHGLKATARYFGVNTPDRVYVDGEKITQIFDEAPDTIIAYCLDDVRETDAISRIMSPSWFYQTAQLPLSYQNCVLRGNATRIDMLLCAEYLQRGAGLPVPMASRQFAGALSQASRTGIFKPVWHIDVRSLYPSVILANQLKPASDEMGLFLSLLAQFREFRLQAKDKMRTAPPEKREYYRSLQSSFKILINSFYGYLGFAQGTFNDYNMAEQVTATGRNILMSMHEFLENNQASVIEMDTDGLYFVPPKEVTDVNEMRKKVQEILPPGIEIELDAVYDSMFSYKAKNYALLDEAGKVHLTGAALRSRGTEPFLRNFISGYINRLLEGKKEDLEGFYKKTCDDIHEHRLPLKEFAKREILSINPASYEEKVKSKEIKRSAALELASKAGDKFSLGGSVNYYVTGNKKTVSVVENSKLLDDADETVRDENVPFYLDKVQQIYQKFNEAWNLLL